MRRLVFIIVCLISTLCSSAQEETSLYVFRNDGAFNAFFYEELDSITFSSVNTDSTKSTNIVVQEFWTPDSVFRIPLEVIDSVSFITPKTIVNDKVFPLTAEHVPYIVEGDTVSFLMALSTPNDMRPQKGSIVASDIDCTVFQNGIIARVTNVETTDKGYFYSCEKASLDDIYDQIVFYGDGNTIDAQQSRAIGVEITKEKELWNLGFDKEWKYSGTTTSIEASDNASCRLTIRKILGMPLYAKIELLNSVTSSIDFNASSEANLKPEPVQIGKTIKAGRISFPHPLLKFIWFEPQISLYGYFEEEGSLDLNFKAHLNRYDSSTFVYSDKKWNVNYSTSNDFGVDVANITMKGFAEVGLIPEILMSLNGTATGIGINSKFGVKQVADFKFDAINYFDTGMYDALKETKTETYRTQSVSLVAQAGLFEKSSRGELLIKHSESLLSTRYLLPTFEEAYQLRNNVEHQIHINVNKNLIMPVKLNMAIYDENDKLVQRSYDDDIYNGDNHAYYYSFTNLQKEQKYKAYPLIKIGKVEMRATPCIYVDYCPGYIKNVVCTGAQYVTNDENSDAPNRFYFDVTAILDDKDDIIEWGLYNEKQIFPFESIEGEQKMSWTAWIDDSHISPDYSSFVVEHNVKLGCYVKKFNRQDGTYKIIYGESKDFILHYDTRPSFIISNPELLGTEVIGSQSNYDEDGNPYTDYHYKTTCSYKANISGTYWIDYISAGISGGDWNIIDDDPWYPKHDQIYTKTWYAKYWTSSLSLNHSTWKIIHIRNSSQTINSNYLNWSGDGIISNVWVSVESAFARKYSKLSAVYDSTQRNYVEEIQENPQNVLKKPQKLIPIEGGYIGRF